MAIKFLDAIDLTGLEMNNVLAQNLASNPTPLGEGQYYYDTTLKVFKYYAGATKGWITLDGQGGVTGITAAAGLVANSEQLLLVLIIQLQKTLFFLQQT